MYREIRKVIQFSVLVSERLEDSSTLSILPNSDNKESLVVMTNHHYSGFRYISEVSEYIKANYKEEPANFLLATSVGLFRVRL